MIHLTRQFGGFLLAGIVLHELAFVLRDFAHPLEHVDGDFRWRAGIVDVLGDEIGAVDVLGASAFVNGYVGPRVVVQPDRLRIHIQRFRVQIIVYAIAHEYKHVALVARGDVEGEVAQVGLKEGFIGSTFGSQMSSGDLGVTHAISSRNVRYVPA